MSKSTILIFVFAVFSLSACKKNFYFSCEENMLLFYKEERDKVVHLGGFAHYHKPQFMGKKDNFVYFVWPTHPESPNHGYTIERIELSPEIVLIRSVVQIFDSATYKAKKQAARHNPYSLINPTKYKKVYNPDLLKLIPYYLKKNERAFSFDRDRSSCKKISYLMYILNIPRAILWQALSAG